MKSQLSVTFLVAALTAACGASDPSEQAGAADSVEAGASETGAPETTVVGAHYITERIQIQPDEMAAFGVTEPSVDVLVLVDAARQRLTPTLGEQQLADDALETRALTEKFFDGLTIPPLTSGDRFKPPRVHGDREFNGTGTQQPIWEVVAKISRSSNKLFGFVSMHAWEDDGDASEGDGATGWIEIATVPAGKIISQIAGADRAYTVGDLSVTRSGRDTNGYQVQTIADPGAVVLNWKIWGDTNGDDLDFYTGMRAGLERIYVKYQ